MIKPAGKSCARSGFARTGVSPTPNNDIVVGVITPYFGALSALASEATQTDSTDR